MNIKKLLRGDKFAWDGFVERFSAVIYSAVLKVFHAHVKNVDQWDVNDVVQEVFIRLIKDDYRLIKSYNPDKASLVTWLTIISRSTAIDFLRRRRLETVSLEEDEALNIPVAENFSDSSIDIPPDLLSARQKLVLKLLFEKGLEPSEIAEFLDINVQTVRSAKHKALTKLRSFFNP